HTQKVPNPTEQEEELLRVPTTSRQTLGLEKRGTEVETVSEHPSTDFPTPVRDKVEDTQENENEPTSTGRVGKPDQSRDFPEADGLQRQTEEMTDHSREGVETDQSQKDLTPPEPVVGTSK
ncbi:hypothetical protein NDU88_002730, partial [Pleurodeles waltl]